MSIVVAAAVGLAQAGTAPPLPTATLDNGLQVVVESRRHVPEVVVLLRHSTGSRDEAPGEHGTTHLLEHLLFEGSVHAPDRGLERTVQRLGGQSNAWTGPDDVVLYIELPSAALERALFLVSDHLGWLASFAPADVRNQQDVVLRERAEWEAAPRGREADALSRALWPIGHPYHHPVFGTVAAVRGATAARLDQLQRERLVPEGAVLAIVGDVDAEVALEAARRWFDPVPSRARPPQPVPPPSPPPPHRRVWQHTSGGQWVLSWSWRGPPADHRDAPALALVPALLSSGQGTPLDDAAFAIGGLADGDASWWAGELAGQLDLSVSVGQPRLPAAARAIETAVSQLQTEGPSSAALRRAVAVAVHAQRDLLEDPVARASSRATCLAQGAVPRCAERWMDTLEALTPAQVQAAAQRWLPLSGGVQLSLVPEGAAGALPGSVWVELP